MNKETLRMQMLSGIITESEYKAKLEEASSTTKFLRKLGWAGETWTPKEFAAQIKNLPDSTLITWAKNNKGTDKGISNTPLAFQQKLVKIEMDKRGLKLEEALKDSLNENFVGIGAINNPFPTRKKSDYELAFDHYMGNINEVEGEEEMDVEEMGEENPIDAITMDVPLFIRMLEFAREDASTDMDLHDLAEKAIAMSAEGEVLSMDNYEDLVGGEKEEMNEDVVKGSNVKKVGDKWRVLSGKSGKMWPQKYNTEKDAKDAIKAYHASK